MQQLKDIIYLFDTSNLYLEFRYNKQVTKAKNTTEKNITCDYHIVPFNKEFVKFNNSIKSYDTIRNLRAERVYYSTELNGIVVRIREYWKREL